VGVAPTSGPRLPPTRASEGEPAPTAIRRTGAPTGSKVVVLSGGTGGAKLARGMLDVVGPEELVVIANTGDDIHIHGARVSPDPDLVSFWLADLIDERGWGLREDTFHVMDALRALGADVWFNLGDRDLAWCLERKRMEDEGMRPTEALRALNERIGVRAAVLPMSDEPVQTWVDTALRGWRPFQEFMIRDRCQGTIEGVGFSVRDIADLRPYQWSDAPRIPRVEDLDDEMSRAVPSPEALAALAQARAVILGPSNPVISIWPILSVLGEKLSEASTPVVCVSPIVRGEIVKGPTAAFLSAYEHPVNAEGVAAFYESVVPGLLDGIVADEPVNRLPTLQADTLMSDPAARARVAEQALSFALSLAV
jgi:LPPG:FO 2-phospho-L-lactate transferase